MIISITNSYTTDLSFFLNSNVGFSSAIDNSSIASFSKTLLTQYVFSTEWAGKIYVDFNIDLDGSKIEGSFIGPPDIDVNYVDEYFVSITCSSKGVSVFGCNIDLFEQKEIFCTTQVAGPVCLNSIQNDSQGPASPFFAACAGIAYIYPKDDGANQGNFLSSQISCCIGTSCTAPSRQKITSDIRSVRFVMRGHWASDAETRDEINWSARSIERC